MNEERKVSEVPIIAVSAFVGKKEIDACLNSGMNDYSKIFVFISLVSKPFTPHRLYTVLMRWMPYKLQVHSAQDGDSDDEDEE